MTYTSWVVQATSDGQDRLTRTRGFDSCRSATRADSGPQPTSRRRRRSRKRGGLTNRDLEQEADRPTGYWGGTRYACTAVVFADLRHGPIGAQSGDV